MKRCVPLIAAFLSLAPSVAHAYAGPGGVITGIGALLALIAAIFAALFGFIWYPIKRVSRRLRRGRHRDVASTDDSGSSSE